MSSKDNAVYFLEVSDPNTCKQLTSKRHFPHPSSVYGVMWDPFNPNRFISGCNDNNVRLFDITSNQPSPIKTFSGHNARVYNVLFSAEL